MASVAGSSPSTDSTCARRRPEADGVAVEIFTVEVGRSSWPDAERLRHDLAAVLDRLTLTDRLAEKSQAYAGQRRAQSARPMAPHVVIDNSASAAATVVELRAPDELGLLHRVTQALFDCDLDVVTARVSTIGDSVVDAFYVRDPAGAKVTDTGDLTRIEGSVLAAVA